MLRSACDKLHNARSIAADHHAGHGVFGRFKQGREDTLWYYRSLLEVFESRLGSDRSLVIELRSATERMATTQGLAR